MVSSSQSAAEAWNYECYIFIYTVIDKFTILYTYIIILWCICPLLDNSWVYTFPQHKRSTIEGHPLLGNGSVHARSGQE
jgi:hypothetical protein